MESYLEKLYIKMHQQYVRARFFILRECIIAEGLNI